jgi:hypothetical protein
MDIALDHLIVRAHNRVRTASLLAQILGVPWQATIALDVPWRAAATSRSFSAVYVNERITLEIDEVEGAIQPGHYCFSTSESALNQIAQRLISLNISYRSTPLGAQDGCMYRLENGGCGLYWSEPDGHVWEALTVSYARQKT